MRHHFLVFEPPDLEPLPELPAKHSFQISTGKGYSHTVRYLSLLVWKERFHSRAVHQKAVTA